MKEYFIFFVKDADDKGLDLYVLEKIALVRMIEVKEKLHREGLLVKIYFVERFDKI